MGKVRPKEIKVTCVKAHSWEVLDLGVRCSGLSVCTLSHYTTLPLKTYISCETVLASPHEDSSSPSLDMLITLYVLIIFCFEYLWEIQSLNIHFLWTGFFDKDQRWIISSLQETHSLGWREAANKYMR